MNTGSEPEIVAVFCAWLRAAGWDVVTELGWVDVDARRGEERLLAEAKGVTSARVLDTDTLYGQLLRRMTGEAGTRYAVVVPEKLVAAALRVPEHVRATLAIDVYGVDAHDVVRVH